ASSYIEALKADKRLVISKDINDRILGIRKGKVYIGEVKNYVLPDTRQAIIKLP
ncbi:hypothetical protein DOT_2946, partial [Desulfosporosinus sp. OT]